MCLASQRRFLHNYQLHFFFPFPFPPPLTLTNSLIVDHTHLPPPQPLTLMFAPCLREIISSLSFCISIFLFSIFLFSKLVTIEYEKKKKHVDCPFAGGYTVSKKFQKKKEEKKAFFGVFRCRNQKRKKYEEFGEGVYSNSRTDSTKSDATKRWGTQKHNKKYSKKKTKIHLGR